MVASLLFCNLLVYQCVVYVLQTSPYRYAVRRTHTHTQIYACTHTHIHVHTHSQLAQMCQYDPGQNVKTNCGKAGEVVWTVTNRYSFKVLYTKGDLTFDQRERQVRLF